MTAKDQDAVNALRDSLQETREVLVEFMGWAKDEVLEHKKILKGNGQKGLQERFVIVENHQQHQCPANTKNKALLVSYCAIAVSIIAAIGQYIPSILLLIK